MAIGPNVNVNVTYKFLVDSFYKPNIKKLKCFLAAQQDVANPFQVLNF